MADILIRGMEIPTDRRVKLMVFPNGYVGVYDVYGRYLANARAVPIPEGHGRMGDLDELETTVIDAIEKGFNAVDILLDIHFAPTIIPAEGGADNG